MPLSPRARKLRLRWTQLSKDLPGLLRNQAALLVLAAALVVRFFRTGGLAMLRMMGGSPDSHEHDHMDAEASH